ncbi:PHD finger protein ALFIN-LIKE 5, variant 2 [Salvia divinorum]|uniref:PHD finger protein ALFIN-LIKE n=1 Tax=Salvia divinorum TaxID=28513 RepID=A0ABD1HER7_SALDI
MTDGIAVNKRRKMGEIFGDFKGRRMALIKALTTDVKDFILQCDPDKANLCLFGLPSGKWKLDLPAEEVPPQLPEPVLGINFARDGMQEKDWLALVAIHSDAWLLSVAFYFGATFDFDKADRKLLFNMINDLPTLYEVVTQAEKNKQAKDESPVSNHSASTSKSNTELERMSGLQPNDEDEDEDEEEGSDEEDEDEHEETLCGACGEYYTSDEFWICCDLCEGWFHGRCVNMTPDRAEHVMQYKCPTLILFTLNFTVHLCHVSVSSINQKQTLCSSNIRPDRFERLREKTEKRCVRHKVKGVLCDSRVSRPEEKKMSEAALQGDATALEQILVDVGPSHRAE